MTNELVELVKILVKMLVKKVKVKLLVQELDYRQRHHRRRRQ